MSGLDQLHDDLERMAAVLEAFEHPEVDRRASARLLRDTLHQRRDAVREKLSEVRRDHLDVVVGGGDVSARVVLAVVDLVLTAVTDEVDDRLGDVAPSVVVAATPVLADLERDDGTVTVRLSGPDRPLEAVPLADDEDTVLGAAMRAVVEELAAEGDRRDLVASVLADGPAHATIRVTGPGGSAEADVAGAAAGG